MLTKQNLKYCYILKKIKIKKNKKKISIQISIKTLNIAIDKTVNTEVLK